MGSWSAWARRRNHHHHRPARATEAGRGATVAEYALLASLVVFVSLGILTLLEDESGSYLEQTGSDIGTPRELAAELDPDLPDPPAWLTQPPPPSTTTTTAATTTTTTTVPTSTTSVPDGSTTSSTTTTTTITYPTGSVVLEGFMSSLWPRRCAQADQPGVEGSTIDRRDCDGGSDQVVAAVGDSSIVALQFTNPVNAGLCFTEANDWLVLGTCDGSQAQLFNLVTYSSPWGDSYSMVSRTNGRCVLEHWTGLRLAQCDNGWDQRFTF